MGWAAPESDVPVFVLGDVNLHGALELRSVLQKTVRHAAVKVVLPLLIGFAHG